MTEIDRDSQEIDNLAKFINEKNPVLMIGAGLSRLVGYMDWENLVIDLKENILKPELSEGEDKLLSKYLNKYEYDKYAELIYGKSKRKDDFAPYIEREFRIKENLGPEELKVHRSLFKLNFSTIVTTNYDTVIEKACQSILSEDPETNAIRCISLNLCNNYDKRSIFDYVRKLNRIKHNNLSQILHFHGVYNHSDNIILRTSEYVTAYGFENEDETAIPRFTLHQKVIWSLLVGHPFVFIGFGMKDPFFMKLADIIKADFDLGSAGVEPCHYAVLPNSEKEISFTEELESRTIKPIYYDLEIDEDGERDYARSLLNFIGNLTKPEPKDRVFANLQIQAERSVNEMTEKRLKKYEDS